MCSVAGGAYGAVIGGGLSRRCGSVGGDADRDRESICFRRRRARSSVCRIEQYSDAERLRGKKEGKKESKISKPVVESINFAPRPARRMAKSAA